MKRFVALGDSISVDIYPQRETGISRLGAVSLLHRNHDSYWPDWRSRDLVSLNPAITLLDLTADGATSEDVLLSQLPRIPRSTERVLVTITAGGNDILMNLRSTSPPVRLVEGMIDRLAQIVSGTQDRLPNARLLLGTVYDPSDGTNILDGERLDREAKWLATFNAAVRRMASESVRIIDIHQHFLGHGMAAAEKDRWYWSGLIFEPNAIGAHEVRRLWWEAIETEKVAVR